MRTPTTISIVTPSYNQGRFIERTLESVRSQSYPALEHLVFDGGSTDGTLEILRKYGNQIVWKSNPDRGQSHAINKGFARARGDIIGWINSDDLYCDGALETVADYFSRHPEALVVYGEGFWLDENDEIIEPFRTREWSYEALWPGNFICQPALFMRRAVIERFGPLDETYHYCMDYEYWLRIGAETAFHHVHKPLGLLRRYAECKSIRHKIPAIEEHFRMFHTYFGRASQGLISASGLVAAEALGLSRRTPWQEFLFTLCARYVEHRNRIRHNHRLDAEHLLVDAYDLTKCAAQLVCHPGGRSQGVSGEGNP